MSSNYSVKCPIARKSKAFKTSTIRYRLIFTLKTRRLWAAIEARSLGWGGIIQVAIATGLSRTTIHAGIRLLLDAKGGETSVDDSNRIRSSGAGRKLLEEKDAMLLSDLESLIEPMTLGNPESPRKRNL